MPDPTRTLILETVGDRVSPSDVDALTSAFALLLAAERKRCANLCRDRVDLWRDTALAKSSIPSAREEARARANEAQYLSDAIDWDNRTDRTDG